ncbi:MAG TPA: hypothetical protein GX400_05090 [Chloroflexi bacterium]|nr:hypothetical protein [Chloroflexota bacterium]
MNPGSIVQVRNRYWVLLPHEDPNLYALRPLTGAVDDILVLLRSLGRISIRPRTCGAIEHDWASESCDPQLTLEERSHRLPPPAATSSERPAIFVPKSCTPPAPGRTPTPRGVLGR